MVEFIVGAVAGVAFMPVWTRVWARVSQLPYIKPVVDYIRGKLATK